MEKSRKIIQSTRYQITHIIIYKSIQKGEHCFMNMDEYQKVKDLTYLEYCDYLQRKYGIGLANYMTKSYNINSKCKRTKEGLIAHHKKEVLASGEISHLLSGENDQSQSDRNNQCISFSFL